MRQEFVNNPRRFADFSASACGVLLDYSKNLITRETMRLLIARAKNLKVTQQLRRQARGEDVNYTEKRAVTHTLLRAEPQDPEVGASDTVSALCREAEETRLKIYALREELTRKRLRGFSDKILTNLVNIGIGGSDLGPYMVCNALPAAADAPKVHFLASPDGLGEILAQTDPETTLFVVSSKSFGTGETLANVRTLKSIYAGLGAGEKFSRHLCAVTSAQDKATAMGVPRERIFRIPVSVGGRFSLWSAIGLPIIMHLGRDEFEELLKGGRDMDRHALDTKEENNLPLIMALLSYWYGVHLRADTHCVNVYEHSLRLFPQFLQQLVMESCGKTADASGERVTVGGHILWGGEGPNVQHSYMQLCHQGHLLIPTDILFGGKPMHPEEPDAAERHAILVTNALAQAQALLLGRDKEELAEEARKAGIEEQLISHLAIPGNRPSNCLIYERLNARSLGSLISLYEHKTTFFGYLTGINPFDQWGVELGKQLGSSLASVFNGETAVPENWDSSTVGLLNFLKAQR